MADHFTRLEIDRYIAKYQGLLDSISTEERARGTLRFLLAGTESADRLAQMLVLFDENPDMLAGILQMCALAQAKEYRHLYSAHLIQEEED